MRIQSASTEDCSSQSCALHFAWSMRVLYFFTNTSWVNLWARCCFSFLSSTFFCVRDLPEVHLLIFLLLIFSLLLPSSFFSSSIFFWQFAVLLDLMRGLSLRSKSLSFLHPSITWKVWLILILFSLPTFSRCLGRKSQECKSYSSTSSHNLRGYTSLSSSFDNFATFSRNLAKCRVAESV